MIKPYYFYVYRRNAIITDKPSRKDKIMDIDPLTDAQLTKLLKEISGAESDVQKDVSDVYDLQDRGRSARPNPEAVQLQQNRVLFGAFIRSLLQRRTMSPQDLADQLDTTQDFVDDLLKGALRMHQITEDTIKRLGHIFNYEARILLAVLKYPIPQRPPDDKDDPFQPD